MSRFDLCQQNASGQFLVVEVFFSILGPFNLISQFKNQRSKSAESETSNGSKDKFFVVEEIT